MLTIVTSGLYTTSVVPYEHKVALTPKDWFDISNATTDDFEYAQMSMNAPKDEVYSQAILYNNMSFPRGTYDEYAFADFQTAALKNYTNGTLAARLPAVRGELNCSSYPVYHYGNWSGIAGHGFYIAVDPPSGCVNPYGRDGMRPILTNEHSFYPPDGYFGWRGKMYWANAQLNESNYGGEFELCGDGRQHLFFAFGDYPAELSVVHCLPYLNVLDVDVTLNLPALTVDESAPLPAVPDEASARLWNDGTTNKTSLPFPYIQSDYTENEDTFFHTLTTAYQAIPISELLHNSAENIDAVLRRMNHLYRQLAAQQLHFNQRTPLALLNASTASPGSTTSAALASPFPATAVNPTRTRLVQNAVSTRLLEGLLLALALCALLYFALDGGAGGGARVLPIDPGSVGARMALFAGSGLVGRLREGGGGVEEVLGGKGFEGERFRLGWWDESEGGGRRFGVDVAVEEGTRGEQGGWRRLLGRKRGSRDEKGERAEVGVDEV
ncbi:hypothetical protein CH63R_03176 [Neofusicoccum parvum]|nr:hypothetical protein CH63R_03176 [Neofusicoccum parvum]